jgi:hypothetical protein
MTLLDMNPDLIDPPAVTVEAEPPPLDPDWDGIADRLDDLADVDGRYVAAMATLRADGTRAEPLAAADLDRARAAASLSCAVDTADLWRWGRWAARRLAEADDVRTALLADLESSEREREALLARAVQAEALTVAAHAAVPNPDGPGLLPMPTARHADAGEVAA